MADLYIAGTTVGGSSYMERMVTELNQSQTLSVTVGTGPQQDVVFNKCLRSIHKLEIFVGKRISVILVKEK